MVELSKYSAGSVSFPTSFHHSQMMALIFPPSSPLTYSVVPISFLVASRSRRNVAASSAPPAALSCSQPHVPELPEPREPRSVLMSPLRPSGLCGDQGTRAANACCGSPGTSPPVARVPRGGRVWLALCAAPLPSQHDGLAHVCYLPISLRHHGRSGSVSCSLVSSVRVLLRVRPGRSGDRGSFSRLSSGSPRAGARPGKRG